MSTNAAHDAMQAWQHGRRRRALSGTLERTADAMMASGAMVLMDAAGPLDMGLASGRVGMTIGAGMMCAGLAWISRRRARSFRAPRPAVARMAVTVKVRSTHPLPLRRAA